MTEREKVLREMWYAGAPVEEIAARFGVHRTLIYRWRAEYGIERRFLEFQAKADPTPSEIEERAAYCRRMREAGTPIGGY